jgi:hypothetical protein
MRLTSFSCRSEMGEKRDVGIFQLGGGWEINASFAQDTMAETENGGHPEACEQARPPRSLLVDGLSLRSEAPPERN